MTQTLALLLDAYRDLNARKLFWITFVLSGIVMASFAFIGVSDKGLTLAGMKLFEIGPLDATMAYKIVFKWVLINVWLTWGAVALALISTAGIFPDLLTSGTIDLYLSKPISRLRLFVTKYFTGLLFVTAQATVFSLAAFGVVGWRAHDWRPSVFLAVPLVVCMFSYLFGFCVLIGVSTRSTIAAILLTVVLWAVLAMVQKADETLFQVQTLMQHQLDRAHHIVEHGPKEIEATSLFSPTRFRMQVNLKNAREQLPEMESTMAKLTFFRRITYGFKTVVPKTGETINMFDRWLFRDDEIPGGMGGDESADDSRPLISEERHGLFGADEQTMREAGASAQHAARTTSAWYIMGTSLACEGVVVAAAAWIFCRRDY